MTNTIRLGTIAGLLTLSVALAPSAFAQSNDQQGYQPAGQQITNTQPAPGHINDWPGAHNSSLGGGNGGE